MMQTSSTNIYTRWQTWLNVCYVKEHLEEKLALKTKDSLISNKFLVIYDSFS